MSQPVMDSLVASNDCVRLNGDEEYKKYFSHVARVLKCLLSWHRLIQGGDREQKMVTDFIEKILNTILALGMKYAFHPSNTLALDLNDSGYPHLLGIMELENDVRDREEMLRKFLPCSALLDKMIDVMCVQARDPKDLLWQMSSRKYFEDLKADSLAFSFTPGEFILLEESDEMRRYLFSWLCYDFKSNVPHVHLMVFDQDKSQDPVHEDGITKMQFLDVVRNHGSRVPDLLVLVGGIDNDLECIHPKITKRIKLGPILSNAYSRETTEDHPLLVPLKEFGKPDDFIFLIRNEMLYSRGQTDARKGFLSSLGPARVREIFAIDSTDAECAEVKVSSIGRQIVLPHHVVQHINFSDPALAKYAGAGRVAYNKQEVFVIS